MDINFFKRAMIVFMSLLMMISCGVDDENSNNDIGEVSNKISLKSITNCPVFFKNQIAQGNFMGTNFVSPGGIYRDHSFGGDAEYFCKIFVKSPLSSEDCAFPRFKGNRDIILFSINSLEPQTFKVSDEYISDNNKVNKTLSFNRVTEKDALTITELSCGSITIKEYDDITGKVYGSVVAKGVNGSNIDGDFVLDFCNKNVF